MTNFFAHPKFRETLLGHLHDSFGFTNYAELSSGVPSEYALTLFNGEQLNPVRLMEEFIVPQFDSFAAAAVAEFEGSTVPQQVAAFESLKNSKYGYNQGATALELFHSFTQNRNGYNGQSIVRQATQINAIDDAMKLAKETTQATEAFRSTVLKFGEFNLNDYSSSCLPVRPSVPMMVGTLSPLVSALTAVATFPANRVYPLTWFHDFDSVLFFYTDALAKFKTIQQFQLSEEAT